MAEMEHHVRAAARAKPNALLGADLPFKSYRDRGRCRRQCRRLTAAGAEFVKAEGGRSIGEQIRAIISAGIPFCGHLGMLPQHVLVEGGYHIKGKSGPEHQALMDDAQALADAGAFAIVLELVTPLVAQEISQRIPVPTIGIGSGPDCDGQILVINDLVGTFPWFTPRFCQTPAACGVEIKKAVGEWKSSITVS